MDEKLSYKHSNDSTFRKNVIFFYCVEKCLGRYIQKCWVDMPADGSVGEVNFVYLNFLIYSLHVLWHGFWSKKDLEQVFIIPTTTWVILGKSPNLSGHWFPHLSVRIIIGLFHRIITRFKWVSESQVHRVSDAQTLIKWKLWL